MFLSLLRLRRKEVALRDDAVHLSVCSFVCMFVCRLCRVEAALPPIGIPTA